MSPFDALLRLAGAFTYVNVGTIFQPGSYSRLKLTNYLTFPDFSVEN